MATIVGGWPTHAQLAEHGYGHAVQLLKQPGMAARVSAAIGIKLCRRKGEWTAGRLVEALTAWVVSGSGPTMQSPLTNIGTNMACNGRSFPGWPCDEEAERLRQAFLDADDAARPAAQQNDRRIARHLPRTDRPRCGSKTGSLPGVANDVGFVMTDKGPLIMAVFCEKLPDPNEGERIIGDVAWALLGAR